MGPKEDIRRLAADLIGKVHPNGACEFMREVTEPLPVQLPEAVLPLGRSTQFRKDQAIAPLALSCSIRSHSRPISISTSSVCSDA